MAEENNKTINISDPNSESSHDAPEAESVKVSDLTLKIQSLEQDKASLVDENKRMQYRVDELTSEIDEWRSEEAIVKEKIEEMTKQLRESEESKTALDSVASRCADLEGEVVRLQDEYVAAINEVEEKGNEIDGLKREVLEKGKTVEGLESEIEELKKSRVELERQVREYERKLGVFEMRESEEKSKRLRVEEELKKKVEELEGVVARNGKDAENWVGEKSRLEIEIGELVKEKEEAEKVIAGLKEKSFDGIQWVLDMDIGGENGSKWTTVLAVGSLGAGFGIAAALVYVRYGRLG